MPEALNVIGFDNTLVAKWSIAPLTATGLETPGLLERLIASVLTVYKRRAMFNCFP